MRWRDSSRRIGLDVDSPPTQVPELPPSFEILPEHLPRDDKGSVLWTEVFEVSRPLQVEIGVGTSTFLIDIAERNPGINFVGIEYSAKRVAKFLKKVNHRGVSNIRMLRVEAVQWIPKLFSCQSIAHFHINHPDPWPKRRHQKKRFVNRENSLLLAAFLSSGGGISLRTDFAEYAQQMLEVLDQTPGLTNLSGPGVFASIPREPTRTLYETKFLKAGVQIFYLEYEKTARHGPGTSHAP